MVAEGLTGKLFDNAKRAPGQVAIGILLGEVSDNAIYITAFNSAFSDPNSKSIQHQIMHVLVPKVLDAQGHKQIESSIVGWYRSELSSRPLSASISEEDRQTQAWFQAKDAAPMSAMMLLDAERREARLYRVTDDGNIMEVQGRKVPATPVREVPAAPVLIQPPPPAPQVAEPIIEVIPKPPPPVPRRVAEIIPSAPPEAPPQTVEPITPLTESSHQTAPAVNVAVKCSNCGCENAGNASFCSKCGASLITAPPLTLAPSQRPAPRSLVMNPQEVQPPLYSAPEPVRTPMGVSRPKKRFELKFIGLILIVIILSFSIIGVFAYYSGFRLFPSALQIAHSPPGGLVIGNSVSFGATVTSGLSIQGVTLTWRTLQRVQGSQAFTISNPVPLTMSTTQNSNSYTATIDGSQLFGAYLVYDVSATDSNGNTVHTGMYSLPIADYDWHTAQTSEATIIRGITTQVALPPLDSLNGFNQPVTIRVSGSVPAGVSIIAPSGQVGVPSTPTLQVTSTSDSQLISKYPIEVDAIYAPSTSSSIQVTRALSLVLTVTDFTATVAPSYAKLLTPSGSTTTQAIYSVTLETYAGFSAPNGLNITVTGLPTKVSWQLVLVKTSVDSTNNVIANYNLVMTAQSGVAVGVYTLDFRVTAVTPTGTITHDVPNLQLQVSTS